MCLTFAEMADELASTEIPGAVLKNRDGSTAAAPIRPMLADRRVRHVGEPVAVVIAETLAQARDAAEMIDFDFTELPVHMDLAEGGAAIHAEAPDNVAYDFGLGDEAATEAAFADAAHVVSVDIGDNRIVVNSMETRGCYAEYGDGRLHLCFNGQGVWGVKAEMAEAFGIPVEAVRVTNPDVGGGFGMKAPSYPGIFRLRRRRQSGWAGRCAGSRTGARRCCPTTAAAT